MNQYTQPYTAVVLLNWNGIAHLKTFLPSVVQHTPQTLADIILIDNHSSDESTEWVTQHFPQIKIIRNSENLGFAGGYNEGLKHVQSGIWVLLNTDVEVTENWLPPLLECLLEQGIAAVQPKILSFKQKNTFEHAGAAGGFIDKFGFPFCRGRIFHELEEDAGQYQNNMEIFWASGACLCIRSEVFSMAGGFEPVFFAHMEEIDLCWRIKNMGFSIRVEPKSFVYHLGGGTLSVISPRKTYLNFRNNLFLLVRNLPTNYLIRILPVRLVLDGLAGILFFFQGKPDHCLAIIKAHFHFYAKINWLLRYRNSLPKKQFSLHLKGVYLGSIVKDFYLRKAKKFTALRANRWS